MSSSSLWFKLPLSSCIQSTPQARRSPPAMSSAWLEELTEEEKAAEAKKKQERQVFNTGPTPYDHPRAKMGCICRGCELQMGVFIWRCRPRRGLLDVFGVGSQVKIFMYI